MRKHKSFSRLSPQRSRKLSSILVALASITIAICLGLSVAAQTDKTAPAKTDPWPKPAGPYAVGVHEYLWVDQKRGEPFTKDPSDHRHLLVRVWYPAEAVTGQETAPYITDVNEYPAGSIYRQGIKFITNSYTDAPIAKGKSKFPVLIYQPGGGTARFVATFEVEQLASQGYVVIAADHPGFSDTILFPDGFKFKPDTMVQPKETGNFKQDVAASWTWLGDEVFPTWTADASYTLDKVEEMEKTPGQIFYKRLDVDRIGMFGWSFGGATSLQMATDDKRVKAAIDQDGQLFGDCWKKGTSRPVMMMHHLGEDKAPKPEDNGVMQQLIAETKEKDQSFLHRCINDWYEVSLANTQHGHFSDFMLFIPHNPKELEPKRGYEIITAYTLAFFNKYLRGQDSDLLKASTSPYPEVTFNKGQGPK